MGEKPDVTIQELLDLGQKARYAIYVGYLDRLNKKETLSSSDFKTMRQLEEEFADQIDMASLDNKGFPDQAKPLTVRNVLKATEYLQKAGYSIGKSSLYNHVKAGLLKPNANGGYDTEVLDKYAQANLKRLDGAPATPADTRLSQLQHDKLEATTQIAIEQARLLKNRNRDFEAEWEAIKGTELAARAALFRNDLETLVRSKCLDIISLVAGNPSRAPELISFLLASFDAIILRYVQTEEFEIDRESYRRFVDDMTATALAVSAQTVSTQAGNRQAVSAQAQPAGQAVQST
jgi:hypothetical protein